MPEEDHRSMLEGEWDSARTQQHPVDDFDLLNVGEEPHTSSNGTHRPNGDGAEVVASSGSGRMGGRGVPTYVFNMLL